MHCEGWSRSGGGWLAGWPASFCVRLRIVKVGLGRPHTYHTWTYIITHARPYRARPYCAIPYTIVPYTVCCILHTVYYILYTIYTHTTMLAFYYAWVNLRESATTGSCIFSRLADTLYSHQNKKTRRGLLEELLTA